MARNKLTDLNNHLFVALERLNEEGLSKEEIEVESKRAVAISKIASQVINNVKVNLDAYRLVSTSEFSVNDLPKTLGIADE